MDPTLVDYFQLVIGQITLAGSHQRHIWLSRYGEPPIFQFCEGNFSFVDLVGIHMHGLFCIGRAARELFLSPPYHSLIGFYFGHHDHVFQIIGSHAFPFLPFIFLPLRIRNHPIDDFDKGVFLLGPKRYELI